MKKEQKKCTKVSSVILSTGMLATCLLLLNSLFAQSYYSRFTNPATHSYVINAGGSLCTASPIQNATAFADTVDSTYSFFTSMPEEPFICTDTADYHFACNLNTPGDTALLTPGYKAGFMIRVPSGISLERLRKYLIISTYLNTGKYLEAAYNDSIMGVDSLGNGVNWYVYFTATKPFNTIEIDVDPNIAPLHATTKFEFDVYYALATTESVFPATLQNFKVSTAGNNVQLSFQSLTETNVANFTVERSNNNGLSYLPVTYLPAKNNGNSIITYAYIDKGLANGYYLYRILTVNKNGTSKNTESLPVSISSGSRLLLYPSVITSGQLLRVNTSLTGSIQVNVYDAVGRIVSRQRLSSSGFFTVATHDLGKGIYTIKIIPAAGNAQQTRFIVN